MVIEAMLRIVPATVAGVEIDDPVRRGEFMRVKPLIITVGVPTA